MTCWTNGIAYSKFIQAIQATLKFHWKQVSAKSVWRAGMSDLILADNVISKQHFLTSRAGEIHWFHELSSLASFLHSLLMHLTDGGGRWGQNRALLAAMRALVLLKEHDLSSFGVDSWYVNRYRFSRPRKMVWPNCLMRTLVLAPCQGMHEWIGHSVGRVPHALNISIHILFPFFPLGAFENFNNVIHVTRQMPQW